MATKKSDLFDYYFYAYNWWNCGEEILDIGVNAGHITMEEKTKIINGEYIPD